MPILLRRKNKKKKKLAGSVEVTSRGVSTSASATNYSAAILKEGHLHHEPAPAPSTWHHYNHQQTRHNGSHNLVHISQQFPSACNLQDNKNGAVNGSVASLLSQDLDPSTMRQELLRHALARQALELEKVELARHLEEKESMVGELMKQLHQRDKAFQSQRIQFDDAIRNIQNGKNLKAVRGESPAGRGAIREDLQLVRDAIASLRSNFRGTDPNQHTLDTLEQAISVLIERGGEPGRDSLNTSQNNDKKSTDKRNGAVDPFTKVIYFTERTVTPFMSSINKPLGEVRLRDFKAMFDRVGTYRFHFKSRDPEYGMVKEEIMSDDDILPGVEGKIIAWVEEDVE